MNYKVCYPPKKKLFGCLRVHPKYVLHQLTKFFVRITCTIRESFVLFVSILHSCLYFKASFSVATIDDLNCGYSWIGSTTRVHSTIAYSTDIMRQRKGNILGITINALKCTPSTNKRSNACMPRSKSLYSKKFTPTRNVYIVLK